MNSADERKEFLFKILVIGDVGTGKTSIIKRYVHDIFSEHYRATIGVDFAMKILKRNDDTIVRLQLWDIAGQERFGNMTRVYYREASGAILVFDLARSSTFEAVNKWKNDLDSKVGLADGRPIPAILLGNKCDVEESERSVNKEVIEEYTHKNDYIGWYETSAKENLGINDAIGNLVNHIIATRNSNEYEIPVIERDANIQTLTLDDFDQNRRRTSWHWKNCC